MSHISMSMQEHKFCDGLCESNVHIIWFSQCIIIIILSFYCALSKNETTHSAQIITPGFHLCSQPGAETLQGFEMVPIYYTWVERDNREYNVSSRGIYALGRFELPTPGGSLTIRLATHPAFKKKRWKGSVFRYTASKGVVDVSLWKRGVFFPLYRHLGSPISQSRFRGVLTPFDILVVGIILKDWSSINFPFYMCIWCLIPCRAHLLTDNDI